LITKIDAFKNKNSEKDFKDLLEATSVLRKEQETEAKYIEKQHE
jgi:hypothetical protein